MKRSMAIAKSSPELKRQKGHEETCSYEVNDGPQGIVEQSVELMGAAF
jgi:hypothetical protein